MTDGESRSKPKDSRSQTFVRAGRLGLLITNYIGSKTDQNFDGSKSWLISAPSEDIESKWELISIHIYI